MKSLLFSIIVLAASQNVFADTSNVYIGADLNRYAKAVTHLLYTEPVVCAPFHTGAMWGFSEMKQTLSNMDSVTVSSSGSQPLLTFSKAFTSSTSYTFNVTTSSDYKHIKSMKYIQQECSDKNKEELVGDLRNPKVETKTTRECIVTFQTECK